MLIYAQVSSSFEFIIFSGYYEFFPHVLIQLLYVYVFLCCAEIESVVSQEVRQLEMDLITISFF